MSWEASGVVHVHVHAVHVHVASPTPSEACLRPVCALPGRGLALPGLYGAAPALHAA